MLLAEPISHTSTHYIDFVDFLHFTGFVYHLFFLILVGTELPLCLVVTLSYNAMSFFLESSIRSFVYFVLHFRSILVL